MLTLSPDAINKHHSFWGSEWTIYNEYHLHYLLPVWPGNEKWKRKTKKENNLIYYSTQQRRLSFLCCRQTFSLNDVHSSFTLTHTQVMYHMTWWCLNETWLLADALINAVVVSLELLYLFTISGLVEYFDRFRFFLNKNILWWDSNSQYIFNITVFNPKWMWHLSFSSR